MAGAVFPVFWRSWRRNFPNFMQISFSSSSFHRNHYHFLSATATYSFSPPPLNLSDTIFPVSLNHQITLVRHHILSFYLIPIFPVSFKRISSSFSSSSSHHHHFPSANCDFIHCLDLLISFH